MSELISVVIPTYDRPARLDACLAGLRRSRYPRDRFEVVVVDDGSPTPLDEVILHHREHMEVVLERQENSGPAAARNRGARLARGHLLAFTDDDCVPDPEWLSTLSSAAATRPGQMIGGRTINVLTGNPFSSASQHLVSYLYEYARGFSGDEPWTGFFASNNLLVPAREFHRIGGFDDGFPLAAGEDRDFCARWSEAGLPSFYAADARVFHHHRLTLSSFWRQHWNYGRGAFHFHRARARRGAAPMSPEPLGFYLDLLRYPFRSDGPVRGGLHAALLCVSQCANALGYFYEKRSRGSLTGQDSWSTGASAL